MTPLTQAKQVNLDLDKSEIKWTGTKKLTEDSHHGVVKLKRGSINITENGHLSGGSLIVDMTTIEDHDLSGNYKKKLESHLNSDDFFDIKNNPEANFKITDVKATRSNAYQVTGNLTIRGITHVETFEIRVNKTDGRYLAQADIEIDRTKYGVTYNQESSLLKKTVSIPKDKIIKDHFELSLHLQTEKL